MRSLAIAVCMMVVTGCGGGELSMNDYATQVEDLLTAMNTRIDTLDAEIATEPSTLADVQDFWAAKVTARRAFIDGLDSIEPPEQAADMHTAAIGIITRLTSADETVAELVAEMETDEELSSLLESPEYLATEAVDEVAIAMCQAAQTEFDSTAERQVFEDAPWIPSELQEVVLVHFGCTSAERGIGE